MTKISAITPAEYILGEGPVWDKQGQRLYWVDIKGRKLLRQEANGTITSWQTPEAVGAAVLTQDGEMLLAMPSGVWRHSLTGGEPSLFCKPEEVAGNRLNDGKCDARGRFWVGSMHDPETEASGHFYCVTADGGSARLEAGFVVTNGIGWNAAGDVMYITDSPNQVIYRLDYDIETGQANNRSVFARISEGYPDGLTVDDEDHVWSCHWDGWRVTRYRPDGSVERVVEMPVPRPTSCVFGGADGDRLFVTSARIGLDQEVLAKAPQSGAVFCIDGLGVTGPASFRFAG